MQTGILVNLLFTCKGFDEPRHIIDEQHAVADEGNIGLGRVSQERSQR